MLYLDLPKDAPVVASSNFLGHIKVSPHVESSLKSCLKIG